MANTSPNTTRSQSETQNPRVARRNIRLPRAGPYSTHTTVPALAARLNRHERQLRAMDAVIQETNENLRLTAYERINQVTEDHENTVDNMDYLHTQLGETIATMEIVHTQGINNQNEIAALQARIQQCEARLRETEEALRMVSRLAESVNHLTTLLPQLNLHRD